MGLRSQRELAAKIMKVGSGRVWIDPVKTELVEATITRKEVVKLIGDGVIKVHPVKGISKGRAKALHQKRKRGKRRGSGTKKGAKKARLPRKRRWIMAIRAIRKKLQDLKQKKAITNSTHRRLYRMAKGGVFKDSSHLTQYIEASSLFRRKTT